MRNGNLARGFILILEPLWLRGGHEWDGGVLQGFEAGFAATPLREGMRPLVVHSPTGVAAG